MVDAPAGGLNDFFASKKSKTKKKAAKTTTAPATEQDKPKVVDSTPEANQKPQDKPTVSDIAAKKPVKAATAFDDSDEEDTQIVLKDDLKSKFKETKDVKKENKKNDDGQRWMIGDQVNRDDAPKEEAPKKSSGGSISFGAKPTFGRSGAPKTAINNQEFPELGDFDNKGK